MLAFASLGVSGNTGLVSGACGFELGGLQGSWRLAGIEVHDQLSTSRSDAELAEYYYFYYS